jgi:SPP1 family predicted phage head-tail adaptor
MQAGKLNRRILIEQKTAVQDPYGEETVTWSTWKTVWANVRPMSGNQYYQASGQTIEARVTTEIRIRYLDGINVETMRVKHGSEVYEIDTVLHQEERRRQMSLMCRRQL